MSEEIAPPETPTASASTPRKVTLEMVYARMADIGNTMVEQLAQLFIYIEDVERSHRALQTQVEELKQRLDTLEGGPRASVVGE